MIGTSPPVRKVLTEASAMVESGKLKPHVSAVLPLHDIRKAHEMIEGRHTRGKIVLQVIE
jgi:NADPH:quinone reductase-like Zn-dependent oxidoreductase